MSIIAVHAWFWMLTWDVVVRQGKEANPDSKHKDKFLVLSAPVSDPEATANFAELWSDIETNHEDTIVNKKIRVHYDITPEQQQQQQQQPTTQEKQQQPPAYEDEGSNGHQTEALGAAAATLGVGAGAAATAQNADFVTPSKQSDREIDEAKQKISAMSEDLKSSSSDNNNEKQAVSSSSEKQSPSSATTQSRPVQPANSGIPIPVVLLVALFSFLIGWKLF